MLFCPKFPPTAVSVAILPWQTQETVEETEEAGEAGVIYVIVLLKQGVVLFVPSALI